MPDLGEKEGLVPPPSQGQAAGPANEPSSQRRVPDGPVLPPTARRQALRDIRREMTDDELASPGVQKLLLDDLARADADCEDLRGYVARFHEADKRAAVLEEKLHTANALEIAFGVGVGLGGAIIGLAPYFWNDDARGLIVLGLGLALMIGGVAARVTKR